MVVAATVGMVVVSFAAGVDTIPTEELSAVETASLVVAFVVDATLVSAGVVLLAVVAAVTEAGVVVFAEPDACGDVVTFTAFVVYGGEMRGDGVVNARLKGLRGKGTNQRRPPTVATQTSS